MVSPWEVFDEFFYSGWRKTKKDAQKFADVLRKDMNSYARIVKTRYKGKMIFIIYHRNKRYGDKQIMMALRRKK